MSKKIELSQRAYEAILNDENRNKLLKYKVDLLYQTPVKYLVKDGEIKTIYSESIINELELIDNEINRITRHIISNYNQ